MRSTKSKSPSSRAGFSLLEVTIASGLGMMVSAMVLAAYFGANKAQALSAGGSMLKVVGQGTLGDVYKKLNQARKIFDRGANTNTFLALVPVQGYHASATLSPGPTLSDVVFPQIKSDGSFMSMVDNGASVAGGQDNGTVRANFYAGSVGNALFFLSKDPKAIIRDTVGTYQLPAFGNQADFIVHVYRFQYYFLVRRALPVTAASIRGTDRYTYDLMHWESAPYLDHDDLVTWMNGIINYNGNAPASQTYITSKLTALATAQGYSGAIDLGANTAATAMYQLATTTYKDLTPATAGTPFVSGHFTTALKNAMKTSYGFSYVAFNTVGDATASGVTINSLNRPGDSVPSYATADGHPWGFEVMVAGPPSGRKVLVHLTVAGRTSPGNVNIGDSYQQLAEVYEY